jgi:hypothetical protein
MPPWTTDREPSETETDDDELPSFLTEDDPDREDIEILTDGGDGSESD